MDRASDCGSGGRRFDSSQARFFFLTTTTGEMAEWSNAADSKSAIRVSVSGVRIPLSPRLLLLSDELEVVDDCNCLNPVRTEVAAVGMVTLRLFNFKGAREVFLLFVV